MSRPRSPLCAWCGAATDLTQSPVMAIYADSEASRQRLVVETCAAPACRALMLQLQNRLRARICEGPRWQYMVADIEDTTFVDEMNKLGAAGWELVFARRAVGGKGEKPAYEVIFKRPE